MGERDGNDVCTCVLREREMGMMCVTELGEER